MSGKCEIKWCNKYSTYLIKAVDNSNLVVYICTDCYEMFGTELPESEAIRLKCQKYYGGKENARHTTIHRRA